MTDWSDVRERLETHLHAIERRLEKIERDRRRDNNALEEDWEEQASVRQNDEVLDGLSAEEEQQATAIRAALARIDDGTYGVCSECGEGISAARLEALPQATICIGCAKERESKS